MVHSWNWRISCTGQLLVRELAWGQKVILLTTKEIPGLEGRKLQLITNWYFSLVFEEKGAFMISYIYRYTLLFFFFLIPHHLQIFEPICQIQCNLTDVEFSEIFCFFLYWGNRQLTEGEDDICFLLCKRLYQRLGS